MMIFDRWGNIVYETHDPAAGWNGRFQNKGEMVQQDVYVYRIDYTDNMYKKYWLIGSVTLLR
jgi:gliding motility-associated-like protein